MTCPLYISMTKLRNKQKANIPVLAFVLWNRSLNTVQLPLTWHILTKHRILITKTKVSSTYKIVNAVWSSINEMKGLPITWHVYTTTSETIIPRWSMSNAFWSQALLFWLLTNHVDTVDDLFDLFPLFPLFDLFPGLTKGLMVHLMFDSLSAMTKFTPRNWQRSYVNQSCWKIYLGIL